VSRATRKTLIDRRDFDVEGYPIRVIHNGVNMPGQIDSDGGNKSNWLKNELKIPLESSFLLGIVGRVERYKGHEDLIVGLSMLSMSERERVFVVVVGAGSAVEVERLNDLAHALGVKNNLRILGYFNEPIERLLVELDMLVMLTKDFEGFGFTVAESMALGTPVIATNVGAVNEFFNNSVGYMIEPESPIMIAQSILRAMHNPDELNKKIQAARIQIQQFDAITMAKNFHRILLVGA
jgi:glycosyltransferase involved in cell wall biosynthesis